MVYNEDVSRDLETYYILIYMYIILPIYISICIYLYAPCVSSIYIYMGFIR